MTREQFKPGCFTWTVVIDILYVDAPPKKEFFVDIVDGIIVTSPDQRQAWFTHEASVVGDKVDDVNRFIQKHSIQHMLGAESKEIYP